MDKQSLCLSYLMGEATAEQTAELSAWIASSPENAQAFALLAAQDAFLSTAVAKHCNPADEPLTLLEELAELDRMSEPAQLVDVTETVLERQRLEKERLRLEAERKNEQEHDAKGKAHLSIVIPKAVVWLGLAAAVALAATLLFYVTPPSERPTEIATPSDPKVAPPNVRPVFATLLRELNAKWDDAGDQPGLLREGEHRLLTGMVELELLSGTRVVLEAPASFVLTGTNKMGVNQGRVVAFVPSTSSGFILDTPNARFTETGGRLSSRSELNFSTASRKTNTSLKVSSNFSHCIMDAATNADVSQCFAQTTLVSMQATERGTEFGVHVDRDHQTRVQVFRGEIYATPLTGHKPAGNPMPIVEAEAAVIATSDEEIVFVSFDEQAFNRELITRLSLADMMMGGDGTTSRQNIGLHALTGQHIRNVAGNKALIGLVSSERAEVVRSSPYVSRVFIPSKDGRIGGLPTGLSLPDLPQTNGIGYGVIWSGAEMPGVDDSNPIAIPTKLPGYNFVGAGQQALVMHTNSGVVIDLDAIRMMNPGFEIVSVHAIVGNASGPGDPDAETIFRCEFLAYLDSESAMRRTFLRSDPDELRVAYLDLEIHEDNRYLTLVSADGGDGNHQDWLIVGDPVVVLRPLKKHHPDFQ